MMYPESDSATEFTVTKSNNTDVNGNIGLTGSQGPSADVSLGFTRSNGLTVEYALSSWYISSHQVSYGRDMNLVRILTC